MKKNVCRFLAMLLAFAMVLGSSTAYADVGISNWIKGSEKPSYNAGTTTGRELLYTADNAKKIEQPNAKDYFTTPFSMYVNAPKEHSVYTYDYWSVKDENKIGAAYHGSRVTVLAEHGDFYCILYFTENNVRKAAWVRAELLNSYYPSDEVYIGSGKTYRNTYNAGDPMVKWSKENFVGTRRKFTILNTGIANCVSFTLDYQVTARNGSTSESVYGPRSVYVNDGSGWLEVGWFDYNTSHKPIHVVVTLPEIMTLVAVATVADCGDPDTFIFRQSVLDVICAE